MPRVTRKNEAIARKFFAPTILKLLRNYSASDLAYAVKKDVNLVELLSGEGEVLGRLRMLVSSIPFSDRVAPYFRSKPWLAWFVSNELKHKRPDLYNQFAYNEKTFVWLLKNMRKMSRFLFE